MSTKVSDLARCRLIIARTVVVPVNVSTQPQTTHRAGLL